MKSENIERQNLAMIILSIAFIALSIIIVLCNKVILNIWGGGIEYVVEFSVLYVLIIFLVVLFSIFINWFYSDFQIYMIVILQVTIGIFNGIGAMLFSFILIEIAGINTTMHNLLSNNLTLSILILTTLLSVASTIFCICFITRSFYYIESYILNNKMLINFKYTSIEQIKNINSTTQLERVYAILVIIVTIIWLNTDYDNIEVPKDPFVALFGVDTLIMMFSLSVYVNYIIMYLFKKNTSSLDELKK